MHVAGFSSLFPNAGQPAFGVFVLHRFKSLARLPGATGHMVAPVPYFPRLPRSRWLPRHWQLKAAIPAVETIAGIQTWHPRYFNPPRIGMRYYSRWMAAGARPTVARLHRAQQIDVIDAHYAYPDGAAAVRIGQALGIATCVTARGSDINQFALLPAIRPQLAATLQAADAVIAVSSALKRRMVDLGVPAEKIAVISNGIDTSVFAPRDRAAARSALQLPADIRIILAVAALVPVKRLDRLIDALALIKEPGLQLWIIGTGPLHQSLLRQIDALGLGSRVVLAGARPQHELAQWYSVADVCVLPSEREGCPNVVIEAMACGAPIVATDVGGIPDLVTDDSLGYLVPERECTPEALAATLERALGRNWRRADIARRAAQRSWGHVAREIFAYWQQRRLV